MHVSTQTVFPTVLMSRVDFTRTTNGGVSTTTVTAGPTGGANNGIFTIAQPPPAGASLVGAVSTAPGSILVAGTQLALTASSLGPSLGLAASDFGLWIIGDQVALPLPPTSVATFSAYGGAISPYMVQPYPAYASPAVVPILDLVLSGGSISGNSFTATATSPSFAGAATQSIKGSFFGNSAEEITGTFTITDPTPGVARIFIGSFGLKKNPPETFVASGGPTLRVSTQSIIPTVLMSELDFVSSESRGLTTSVVTAGPNGTTFNGVFTLGKPPSGSPPAAGGSMIGAIATQATLPPGTITTSGAITVAGEALQMNSIRLGSFVGLTAADFGLWIVEDVVAAPAPPNAYTTFGAFAGGALPTVSMPTTGTVTFNGKMAGELAIMATGGSDDANGDVNLVVDFATGSVTGSISNIATTQGLSTLVPYAPNQFLDMTIIGNGVISGNTFTATVTSPSIPSATITTIKGKFFGSSANELVGTFVLSDPSPGPGMTFIGAFGAKP